MNGSALETPIDPSTGLRRSRPNNPFRYDISERAFRTAATLAEQSEDATLLCASEGAKGERAGQLSLIYANSAAQRLFGLRGSSPAEPDALRAIAAKFGTEAARAVRESLSRASNALVLSLQLRSPSAGEFVVGLISFRVGAIASEQPMAIVFRKLEPAAHADGGAVLRVDDLRAPVVGALPQADAANAISPVDRRFIAIGRAAAGFCHDTRNLMLAIRGHLDALDHGTRDDAAQVHVRAIGECMDYLEQTTGSLQLLTQDSSQRAAEEPSATSIREWIERVRSLFREFIPTTIRFNAEVPSELPCVSVADHRLTQAVFNLLLNAREAISDSGSIRLWAKRDTDGPFVRVGVTDDGCGMTQHVRECCLVPFFTTRTERQSTGLGLSLVHGVAVSAGGAVEIDSEPGRGTTIALKLPTARKAPDSTAAPAQEVGGVATISLRDRRTAACAATLLKSAGFAVREGPPLATDGAAIWVTDPSRSALATARKFRAEDSRCRIVVVGHCSEEWRSIASAAVDRARSLVSLQAALGVAAGGGCAGGKLG